MKYLLACIVIVVSSVLLKPAIAQDGETYLTALLSTSPVIDTTSVISLKEASMSIEDNEEIWKTWQMVENYTYGKDRGSLPMIADLNSLHPYFRDRIAELIAVCKKQGIELAIVESYRTHAKQGEYFGMGKKYTRTKGGKSKHQYGLAVDVVPMVDGNPVWEDQSLWKTIGMNGEQLGLRWGGRWRSPYDPAHFEWSGGITATQLANGLLPVIPGSHTSLYPCIDEDVKKLQEYWEAWETEQSVIASSAPKSELKTSGATGQ